MTTAQLVQRLTSGEKVTLKELHRLEARLAGLYQQAKAIEDAINRCYRPRDRSRGPDPRMVEGAP